MRDERGFARRTEPSITFARGARSSAARPFQGAVLSAAALPLVEPEGEERVLGDPAPDVVAEADRVAVAGAVHEDRPVHHPADHPDLAAGRNLAPPQAERLPAGRDVDL